MHNYNLNSNWGQITGQLPFMGSGKVFAVGDSSTANIDMLEQIFQFDPDGDLRFFQTIDEAINECTADAGDHIYVMPGHAESVVAASGFDLDVAGISVIGLGVGDERPTITFATSTAADVKMDANNCAIKNLIFVCNIASQVTMVDVSGTNSLIEGCSFREGTATGLNFLTLGTADNDCDRAIVRDCDFYAPTAGNMDEAIGLTKDHIGVVIEGCRVYGDFDEACIEAPAAGNAQVDMLIRDCTLTNLLSGQHAIQVNGTGSTGKIIDCRIETDALATSIDAGGLEMYNALYNAGADNGGWSPVAVSVDNNPILGIKVSKSAATLPATTTQDIFTVAGGRCLITLLSGEVTTVVQAQACNLSVVFVSTVGTDYTLASVFDINADLAGDIYHVEGDGTALVRTQSGVIPATATNNLFAVAEGTINITTAATNTGATSWEAWYFPLDAGATIVSA